MPLIVKGKTGVGAESVAEMKAAMEVKKTEPKPVLKFKKNVVKKVDPEINQGPEITPQKNEDLKKKFSPQKQKVEPAQENEKPTKVNDTFWKKHKIEPVQENKKPTNVRDIFGKKKKDLLPPEVKEELPTEEKEEVPLPKADQKSEFELARIKKRDQEIEKTLNSLVNIVVEPTSEDQKNLKRTFIIEKNKLKGVASADSKLVVNGKERKIGRKSNYLLDMLTLDDE